MTTAAQSIAAFVRRHKDAILADWKRGVRELPAASGLSEPAVEDQMPEVLDALAGSLERQTDIAGDPARIEHTLHRFVLGLDLEAVAVEYHLLRRAVTGRLVENTPDPLPRRRLEQLATLDEHLDRAMSATITELAARREERVRIQEARLRQVLEHLPVGVWFTDEHGRIVWSNPAARDIWGGARYIGPERYDEYRGWWPDGRRIAADEWALARAIRSGEVSLNEEIDIRTFDGRLKRVRNSALPLLDESGHIEGAVVLNEDITERKRYEEARDRFIAMLGHDLRNPLNVIGMGAAVMQQTHGLPEQLRPILMRIIRSVSRMERIINDVLDFARAHLAGGIPVSPGAADLAEIVIAATEEAQAANPHRDIAFELEGDLGGRWDAERLRQALGNLIGNAIKHGEDPVRIVARSSHDEVLCEVSNTGHIPADVLPELFRAFRSRGPDRSGIGLGLYIASEIITAHAGTVHASSGAGRVTVGFRLPRCP